MLKIIEDLKKIANEMLLETARGKEARTKLEQTEAALSAKLARVQGLDEREAAIKQKETLLKRSEDLVAAEAKLSEDRDAFLASSSKTASEQKALAKKLADERAELDRRQEKLTKAEAALEKEKTEYKERIEKQVTQRLTGRPSLG